MLENYVLTEGFGGSIISLEIDFIDREPLVLQYIEEQNGSEIHTGLQVNGQAELYLSNEEDQNFNYSLLENVEGLENALPVTLHVQEGVFEKILSAKDEQTVAKFLCEMFSLSTWDEAVVMQKMHDNASSAGISGDWSGVLTLVQKSKEQFAQVQDILHTSLDNCDGDLQRIQLKISGSNPFIYGLKVSFGESAEAVRKILSESTTTEESVSLLTALPFFAGYALTVEEKVAEIARKRCAIIVVMRAPNAGEAVDKLRKIPGYENTEEKDLDKILADPAHNLERGVVFTLEDMKTFVIATE